MSKTFNIYCDESCHIENDHKPFMFLGMVSSAYPQVRRHTKRINELKKEHNFYAEIKWSNVSLSKIRFYLDLVDYFFDTDLRFRTIGIKKEQIRCNDFDSSFDDFYYKMYYHLLNHNLDSLSHYNVYLDIKDTLSANKVRKLREILNVKYGIFRNVQNIRSEESTLMQLADFLMGAISYNANNAEKKNLAKVQIIEKIRKHAKIEDLTKTNYSDKLNLFFIELSKQEDILVFSVAESEGTRTYIYDKDEHYVIVLAPLRKKDEYYLLTAYYLEGKDKARNKMMKKYRRKLDHVV